MNSKAQQVDVERVADLLALDGEGRPLLIAEVKARRSTSEDGVLQLLGYLEASDYPFGMFADLSGIAIFARGFADPKSPVVSFKTSDILAHYEPEFDSKRIFPDYFETLIEAWLRDFAFHWKSERPPGSDQMEGIGLAQKLSGGMTHRVGSSGRREEKSESHV
jgi:hypothetical protein